jgi:dolichol-phosphate mannosyltransferase
MKSKVKSLHRQKRSSYNRDKLSLIIPTYNETDNLPILIGKVHEISSNANYEIIIVDDNSPDGTWAVAEQMSHKFDNVKVIRRARKMNLASAFLEGLNHAEGNVVGLMDADLQHPPELLPKMLNEVRMGVDIAIASRYAQGGKVDGWSFHRRITSRSAIVLAHLLLPKTKSIKDPISGFFLLRKEVIEGLNLNSQGFKILLEILIKGNYTRVSEIPYIFKPRMHGKSKMRFKELWNYIKHLHRLMKDAKENIPCSTSFAR